MTEIRKALLLAVLCIGVGLHPGEAAAGMREYTVYYRPRTADIEAMVQNIRGELQEKSYQNGLIGVFLYVPDDSAPLLKLMYGWDWRYAAWERDIQKSYDHVQERIDEPVRTDPARRGQTYRCYDMHDPYCYYSGWRGTGRVAGSGAEAKEEVRGAPERITEDDFREHFRADHVGKGARELNPLLFGTNESIYGEYSYSINDGDYEGTQILIWEVPSDKEHWVKEGNSQLLLPIYLGLYKGKIHVYALVIQADPVRRREAYQLTGKVYGLP